MEVYYNEYEDLVAVWPNPVLLSHPDGVVYLMFTNRTEFTEAKWFGHITADNVITGAKVFLELLKKRHNSKFLNDKTEASGDWEEANDWLEYEWLPQIKEAGLRCFAHVYSNNMFSRLSSRDLYLRMVPNVEMENFLNRKEAEKWLHSCSINQTEKNK
ncbi:hypothetical protein ACFSRY_11075 [Pontibacter locisalis]|uniref:STAS/SEC14 domain-containing protein n=1 Tax=Pontibacter locisalis TaxID=1719035 RepID=A0ABW5ILW6_9BACT